MHVIYATITLGCYTSYVIASAEADTYERTRCILGEIWEKDFLKVADYEIPPIQAVGYAEGF